MTHAQSRTERLPGSRPLVFVTVGSDHHHFDRLVQWVDAWAETRLNEVDCVVQHGPAAAPRFAIGVDYLPHDELIRLMAAASAVVVQGGPMSIVEARSVGKLPIVTPRLARLREVVDDHQVVFSRRWAQERRLVLAESQSDLHAALDSMLADPAQAQTQADPERDEKVALAIGRIQGIAASLLGRKPGVGPQVVMIGGAGRSGSTLLERCLAEVPGVAGMGETLHLWDRGLLEDQLCGCGQPFGDCPFWVEVGERAYRGWAAVNATEAFRDRADVVRGRRIPELVVGGATPRWRLRRDRLLRRVDRLYEAAAATGQADVLVDSSKHPAYGYLLRAASVQLRCVLVVRDPRGVAYSWSKSIRRPEVTLGETLMPTYSPFRVATDWVSYRLLFQGLRLLRVPLMVVHYEDFVRRPRATVARVLEFCGVEPTEDRLEHLTAGEVLLSQHHTVAGNPMRFRAGRIQITPDDAWRRDLGRCHQLLVAALTAPFLLWDLARDPVAKEADGTLVEAADSRFSSDHPDS